MALSIRWAFITGASLLTAYQGQFDSKTLTLLAGMLMFNLVATLLTATSPATPVLRALYLASDLIFAGLAFYLGDSRMSWAWMGLLPVATAALYFSWAGFVSAFILILIFQVRLATSSQAGNWPILIALMAPLYLLVGLPLALVSERTILRSKNTGGNIPAPSAAVERKERESRKLIYSLISALSATLNYQTVLETSLDMSAETLGELGAPDVGQMISAVFLYSDTGQPSPALHIATARHLQAADRDLRLPGASGMLAQAIDEGAPISSRNLKEDAELSRLTSLEKCRSAFCLPLRAGLDAYGILLFAHPNVDFFTSDRREVLEIVAKQSVIAIQNARLYQDLEQEKNRMMEIQEESRKKLARDLHDGPTQSISAIAMRVNFARRLLERDQKAASEELYRIEELARRTTKEIRHMLFTLRPLVLESQGLVAALETMAEKMKETFNQDVIIQTEPRVVEALEANKQAVVFYIAEEAVNNARKHAQATRIWVRLKMLRDGLSLLEVEDDGIGFDMKAVGANYQNRGSLGMINLRERTDLVNGVLRIDSASGRGTRVQVVIPLTDEAAERLRRGV